MLTDILVNISIEYFIHEYTFFPFLSAFCRPFGGAVFRQSLSLLHLFKFFVVMQVCSTVVGTLVLYFHAVGMEVPKVRA